jgi:hypothetical protein
MARQLMHARSATVIMNSPLRHATGALAVSAGFAYVLEAEDQFHRSVWFGVMFAGITGAWFILGSFLALIDAIAVWWTAPWDCGASGWSPSRPARWTTSAAWTNH